MLGGWWDAWDYSQLIFSFFFKCLFLWICFLILWLHQVRWRGCFYHISVEGWEDLLVVFQTLEWYFIAELSHNKIHVLLLTFYLQKLHFKHWSRSKKIPRFNIHQQDTELHKTKQTNHRTGRMGRADTGKRYVHIMAECWLYKQRECYLSYVYDFYCITVYPNINIFVTPSTATLIMVNTRWYDCLWSITKENEWKWLSMIGGW